MFDLSCLLLLRIRLWEGVCNCAHIACFNYVGSEYLKVFEANGHLYYNPKGPTGDVDVRVESIYDILQLDRICLSVNNKGDVKHHFVYIHDHLHYNPRGSMGDSILRHRVGCQYVVVL